MKKIFYKALEYMLMICLVIAVSTAFAVYQADLLKLTRSTFPNLTFGNGIQTNDLGITFDGDAEDFYIAHDNSADDLIVGLGTTVGTTPKITISDYGSDKATVKVTGQIRPIYIIDGTTITGGAKTLTADDCGQVIVDKDATPATTWTLPANAVAGCRFMFINGIDQTASDTVTAATTDTISGVLDVNDTLTACSLADVITVVNTADAVGDWFEVISDGTLWWVHGDTTGAAALTCTG